MGERRGGECPSRHGHHAVTGTTDARRRRRCVQRRACIDTPTAGDRVETSHMVASPPLHRARRQQMSFIESRIEAPATSSLPRIAPGAELDAALGEPSDVINSRLIINGLDDGQAARRESVRCIDIIASPAAPRGRRGSSLEDATLISLSGVFPFTSALLGFISALAAARLSAGYAAAVAYYGVSGFEWMLTWTTRCLLTAYLSRHLAPAVLPSTLFRRTPLRRPRPQRAAFLASSISCQLGFFPEMSWKLVNDALLA
jgi:hypothetical protein